jgi:hypothetical protein
MRTSPFLAAATVSVVFAFTPIAAGQPAPGYSPPGTPPGYGPPGYPQPPYPGPPRYRLDSEPITELIIAGTAIAAGIYVLGIPVTLGIDVGLDGDADDVSAFMAIPLVGPWVAMGASQQPDIEDYYGPLIASGVLQAGGMTLLVIGAALRRDVQVPIADADGPTLAVLPWALDDAGGGLALTISGVP